MNRFRMLLDVLFPPRADERVVREISKETLLSLVDPRYSRKTEPDTVALLPLHHPQVRALIHEAKYHANDQAFHLLSAVLTHYLRTHSGEHDAPQCTIVPIPLSATRKRERGYNQAEEVARLTAVELQIPLAPTTLARVRHTASQVSLSRAEREENLHGAFSATEVLDPTYLYIVVDDVTTTGATLRAALTALQSAGATRLLPIALAH